MKKRLFVLLNIITILSLMVVTPAFAQDTQRGLQPGETVTYEQKIPVNIVFIGYDQNMINQGEVLEALPSTYEPIVRVAPFYGMPGDVGLRYNFEYKLTFTNKQFNNRFFKYLTDIGTAGDPTLYQQEYNNQASNVLDVTGPVLHIDAPTVEKWLARNLAKEKAYTVVFINWYSRPDFQFHVYQKTDEPDPDTGDNFGLRGSRKMIAWGGTHSRLWFYDLSAGPERWTNNWNVDEPDLDGNGVEDYRMPPIWEYAENGYRALSELSADLAKVTRFVAINLLFTSSPLYDPMASAPGPRGKKIVHVTMFEDNENSLGTDIFNTEVTLREFANFQPYYDWEVNVTDVNPIDDRARRAFRIFSGLRQQDDCWNEFGTIDAELFCFFSLNYSDYVPTYNEADYVAAMFAFNTTDARMGANLGLLGFADDNWMDGTPSFVFAFDSPALIDAGFGFTTTLIHEGGHHFGMSHPHDGYDSELDLDYGPSDEFYYAWSGDESHSIMQYIALTNEFGQFDKDNVYRWEMAGYLNWSNMLLAEIQAHPNARKVNERVRTANRFANDALKNFDQWRYRQAAANARKAFEQLALAALQLGIEPSANTMLRLAPTQVQWHKGDPVRYPTE